MKNLISLIFFFRYNKNNPKLYFSIINYDTNEIGMNSKDYVIESFTQVSKKIDKFHYIIKKIEFNNGTHCFLFTMFTTEKGKKYITYDLVYQPKNIIFDFTYKTFDDEKLNEVNYRKFLLVVESFEIERNSLIDSLNFEVKNEKQLTFEELKMLNY